MKILTAEQLRKVDRQTLIDQQISSLELMERAASSVVAAIFKDLINSPKRPFSVVCGVGDNGGDGLAIARLLMLAGESVKVYLLQARQYSKDNEANQKRFSGDNISLFYLDNIPDFSDNEIIIDCLFGTGLSRPLTQDYEQLILRINTHPNLILSVDMPSGLLADRLSDPHARVVRATKIYTFQIPKMALLLPCHHHFNNNFEVLDIQLQASALDAQISTSFYIDQQVAAELVRPRTRYAHKGSFGHVLMIGGSHGKIGAVVLSSLAAMRSGCGLCTAYLPGCGYTTMQTAIPEVMVLTDLDEEVMTSFPNIDNYAAVGVGMGMGTDPRTQQAFAEFITTLPTDVKLVLDADALNSLASEDRLLSHLLPNTILTPHPKELERLIGKWSDDFDKIERVKAFSSLYKVIVLVKGANSMIVSPDGRLYFNATGNAGMATAGSGDVLTGILTSLLGQGYEPLEAVLLGVYLHGAAGDRAKQERGEEGLIASDIAHYFSPALQAIKRTEFL
jgi:hydroxyethylthiazole kinase-like uncharacterized protein yjeF